ncbi:MAG: PIN domain-containing protein [Opitutales bacterium]
MTFRRWLIEALEATFRPEQVLPIDRQTSMRYGQLRHLMQRRGTPVPYPDLWIAAQSQQHALTVLTLDTHYERVPNLDVLR